MPAVVSQVMHDGKLGAWPASWVNSFGPRELRSEWFPASSLRIFTEAGRPGLGVPDIGQPARRERRNPRRLLRCVRLAGTRRGQVFEAKVGPDRVKPTQLRFLELALRFHRLEQFMIIEVAGPSLRVRLP